MAKSFLDIISLTRRIGEENNKMQRTPTARSSTTQTTQKKKKSLADITALTRSVGGGAQPTTTVQNVARANMSLSEQADAEMQANAKVFNPYAPNYGQYTAEDYGYKTGQQTVEPTVTAQTPRQRAESAVSIKEQTDRNSRELLLKSAWKKSQNAVISAQEEYDQKRDSKSESALRAARARANTAEKAYNDFVTDYKSSVVGYSDEDYKKFKVARTLQEIAAQRQQDYNNALIQWTGRGKKDDRYKAYMESAKRKLDEANAAVQRAEAKRTGSFYTDDEGNVYATKDALDRAIKAKERASSRDLAEFAAQRALQGNAADMRALDEQTREEYERLQERTEREQAEIAGLRNARAEAQKRQKQMDDIGEALILEREVRQNPAAFEANVAAGQQQSSAVSRSLANDGESPYRTLTTYEQQTYEALLGSGQADKAQAYIAAKEDELARRAGYLREEYEREENPFAPVANLLTSAGAGIVSGAEGLVNAFNAVTGNEDTVDWGKEADYFRQYRAQDIAEGRTGSQLEQVAGDIIYNIGRMTPAVAASLAGAPAWVPSVIVGVSAGGNAYSEAIENGMDAPQAATYAVLNGLSEALMERFLGGIQQLTGGRSATQSLVKSWMSDFAKRSAFTSLVADAVASFGGEFVEETLQSLIEPALKNVTWGTSQAADVKEALYEGLLGGLTGVLMTGAGSIGTYIDAVQEGNVSPRLMQEQAQAEQATQSIMNDARPYLQTAPELATMQELAQAISQARDISIDEAWQTLNNVANMGAAPSTTSRRELNRARAAEPTLAEQLRAVNNNTLLGDFTAADAAARGQRTGGRDVTAGATYDYAAMADDIARRTNYPVTAQDISAVVPTALDLGSTSAETAQAADAVARSIIERAGDVPDAESVARLAGAIGDAVYETVNARTIYEATHDASGKVIPPNQRQTNILYGNETKAWRQQQEKARRYRGGKTVYDAFFTDVGELERLSRLGDQNAVTLNDQVQQVRDATKRANTILQDNLVDRYGNVLGPSFDALARETNLGNKDFQRYLLERRNIETLERGKNVTASTAEESQRYVDRINKLQPHYAEYAQRIYDWIDAAGRAYLVDTGLMSAEQYDAMRAQEPSYIPVIRQFGQEMQLVDPLEIGTPVIGTGTGVRRMEGGKTDVLDLRDSISRYFARLVRNAAQNDLLVKIYDMAQNTPGAKGYVALAADLPGRNDVTSLDDVVVRPDTAQGQREIGSREYVLEARIDGQGRGMYVTRPMYEAVERLFKPREVGPIEGVARKITGIQRQIFTQKNPFFVARNQMRDLQTYLATTDGNQVRNLITYFTSLVPKAGTENARLWKQYKDMGLKQESSFLGGKGDYEAYLKTQLGIRESKGWGKAGALLRDLARALEAAGEWSENAPRFAEYKNALRKYGDTPEGRVKAAQAAAEITVNFSRGGTLSRRINSFVPFFNAGMQGLDKIMRNFRNKPGRSAFRYLGKTTLASILINLIAGNYDNRNYDELNDRAKAGYWNIPIGLLTGDVDEDGKSKTFLKLRKGEAESLFGALGEQIARMLVGSEEWDAQKLLDTAVEGFTNMAPNNPLSSNMFAPFIEISQNRDWAGRDIVPANLQDMPPELQYDATTSWTSKQLGQLLGVSPMMLDHLLTGYGSDYGKFIKSITSTAEGGDLTSSLRNTFIADPRYSSGVVSNFYDANRRIQDDVKRIEARDDYVDGTKTEAHAAETEMKKIAKEMSDLTKEEKRIQGDTTLSTGEKRQRINALREQRNALARGAEERVAAAVEEWKATYVPEFDGRSEKAIEELNELRGTGGMSDAQLAEVYDVLKDAKADKATGRSAAQVKAEYIDSLNLSDPGPLYEKFVLKDDEENAEKLMLAKNNGLTATEYYDIISTKPRTDEKGETISNSKYIDQLEKILASDASNKYDIYKALVAKDTDRAQAEFRITEDLGFTSDTYLAAYNRAKAITGNKDRNGKTISGSHDRNLLAYLNSDESLTPNERRALYITFATTKGGYNSTLQTLIGATSFDPRVKNTLYMQLKK